MLWTLDSLRLAGYKCNVTPMRSAIATFGGNMMHRMALYMLWYLCMVTQTWWQVCYNQTSTIPGCTTLQAAREVPGTLPWNETMATAARCRLQNRSKHPVHKAGPYDFDTQWGTGCNYLRHHLLDIPQLCGLLELPARHILDYFNCKSNNGFGASRRKKEGKRAVPNIT